MMGIPMSGPSYIKWGQYVSSASYIQTRISTQKEEQSVCYYAVHESGAMGKSLVEYIPSSENVEDLMTKVLHWQKRKYLVSNFLYDTHDDH